MTIQRFDITSAPGPIMSRCVIHGNNIYLAGITAQDLSGDVGDQLGEILATIDDYLDQAGSDKSKILTAQVWLADMTLVTAMNEVWNTWVDPTTPPARACVSGALYRPEVLVEIQITAVIEA
ncbi:MAG: RidA family protein [Rhodospirillaceae bacterium]|jgi:enamine deaminase RidA (YjgF/YER057c/UK114 family)|nr:RidA family protein [Rhodospirillaceae bacterium]MBT5812563.1 RidA family protein [Rhodospirillaceae bacterium]